MNIDLAFSLGGLVGHASYLLLVVSMLMRSMLWLRLLVISSAVAGICYDWIWLSNPVGVFWEGLLLAANVGQIALLWRRNRSARFTAEERFMLERGLGPLQPAQARSLLARGRWADAAPGEVLAREGSVAPALVFVAEGSVGIEAGGRAVATCGAGNFVGELSLIDGSPATATATVATPARLWRITAEDLARLRAREDALANALDAGILRDLRAKIVLGNSGARSLSDGTVPPLAPSPVTPGAAREPGAHGATAAAPAGPG